MELNLKIKNPNNDPLLAAITHDISDKYKCHTVILYGSHARSEATPTSDYDIICIREKGDLERDCRLFKGFYLDIFVYSEEMIANPDLSLIRIKDGIVLYQKSNMGDDLLNKIKSLFQSGPPKTPKWEKDEINTWVMKMLDRAKQDDIEANFRRHWLLHDLLECYFKLREQWYLGPKESFQWLKNNDSPAYSAFETALKPDANTASIENLIKHVIKTY